MKLTALAQKAVSLLRAYHVFTKSLTPCTWSGRTTTYAWTFGIYDIRTGKRVQGFSKFTLRELEEKGFFDKRFQVENYYTKKRGDQVYSLSRMALETFVLVTMLKVVRETSPIKRTRKNGKDIWR